MNLNTGWETVSDGWWDDVDPEIIVPEIGPFVGGFWLWGDFVPPTTEERVDRIEAWLRLNRFIAINPNGDKTETKYPF